MIGPQQTDTVRQTDGAEPPTRWGAFRALGCERWHTGQRSPEMALALHSQCVTGEVLRFLRCDCGEQLVLAIGAIAAERCRVLIFEQQEGRGLGPMATLQAYAVQDERLDTIAAKHALEFEADCRDFMLPADILNHFGTREIRLLSNNPDKRRALARAGDCRHGATSVRDASQCVRHWVFRDQTIQNGPHAHLSE